MFSGGGEDTLRGADQYFKDIDIPDYDRMIEEMRALAETGEITPEQYKAVLQDPSLLANYSADPRLKGAQMTALSELERIGTEGGMTAADKARLGMISRNVATEDKGRRDAIMQRAAERGVAGSGLDIVNQLSASQSAADRAAMEGADVAARAEERALSAIMNAGQLGGNIRGQDFQEKQGVASAQDAINRFNAAQRTDANRYGADVKNLAKYGNRDYRTNIQTNVNDLRRGRFDDQIRKASGRAGLAEGLAGMQENRRNAGQQSLTGGLSAAILAMSDINAKENIEPGSEAIDEFFKELTVNEYDYKEPEKFGEGKHFGPMAQDLEKSEVGETMVEETPEGKMVDYEKGLPIMMAAIKELYDEVEGMKRG
jgi:hypothetical protein